MTVPCEAEVRSFPNCCKAKVLGGFGETDIDLEEKRIPYRPNYEACCKKIRKSVEVYLDTQAFLVVTSTSCQHELNKALEHYQFETTGFYDRAGGGHRKIAIWYLPLFDYKLPRSVS